MKQFSALMGLVAGAQALSTGFNYGATQSDGSTAMEYSDYQSRFERAKSLQGTNGEFTSARLYTMIQSGTTSDPSSAFQAAIDTKTSLLLGIWCSAGQEVVTNELSALSAAIKQYGSDFTDLVVGISVGSEDLYRVSPTGIENESGYGATPDELVSYIKQTRDTISGTALSGASLGHVDTWTAWVNGSNNAVTDAVDWLGMDTYPYFETTESNAIDNGKQLYWDAYDKTKGVGGGKEVWITETGWPVSGKLSGAAVASVSNAETYWQEVACAILGNYNVWWYTLEDSIPTTPNPSFGLIGSDLDSEPLYDLTCKKGSSATATSDLSSAPTKSAGNHTGGAPYGNNATSSGVGATASGASGMMTSTGAGSNPTGNPTSGPTGVNEGGSPSGTASASAGVASQTDNAAAHAGVAIGAGVLAVFGLVAAL
jgi:glucan endo-1,3-beta-D-glucosidase